MKITLHSTNIMSWAEGLYGNLSLSGLLAEEDAGFNQIQQIDTISEIKDFIEDASHFRDPQIQMIALFSAHFNTLKTYLSKHPSWAKLRKLTGKTYEFTRMMSNHPEALSEIQASVLANSAGLDDSRPRPESLSLHYEPDYFAEGPDYQVLVMASAIGMQIVVDGNEIQPFEMLGRMGWRHARTSRELLNWASAVILAIQVAHDRADEVVETTA